MTRELDPIVTTERLAATYRRYLKTVFPLRDEALRRQFSVAVETQDAVVTGPLLEASPPFRPGRSIRRLVTDGVLHPGFLGMGADDLPLDRPLYLHQDDAIGKVLAGRNVVVATGTGSGKTESVLIPILDALFQERQAGTITESGVRALLLYPMNALANDQLKRLRHVLANTPEIRFGRFTGETKERRSDGIAAFRAQHPGAPVLPNEVHGRDDLRANPPHLLLTNYAMLEYLLLRPADSELFDGPSGRHWRYLVLDEAHTYDGATGIETAMLLRRLKDRVVLSEPGRLRCIATSATIGHGRADYPAVAEFASALFGEPFVWSEDDPDRQDIVDARREAAPALAEHSSERAVEDYARLRAEVARRDAEPAASTAAGASATAAWLYGELASDARLLRLRRLLATEPRPIGEAADAVCPEAVNPIQSLTDLVALAARAKPNDASLSILPARYHFFARALEGAFVCLADHGQTGSAGPRLFLNRHERCPVCVESGQRRRVFELATCVQCGAAYLVGRLLPGDEFAGRSDVTTEPPRYLYLGADVTDDEDEAEDDAPAPGSGSATLCIACGLFRNDGAATICGCPPTVAIPVTDAPVRPGDAGPRRCHACGAGSGAREIVRAFITGQDAPVSVLATALYEGLPPSTDPKLAALPGAGRKLLVFADSRQDAAFFAPYLASNHQRLLRRRLLYQVLTEEPDAMPGDLRLRDVAGLLIERATAAGLFSIREGRLEQQRAARTWVMQELISWDRRNSLEGSGLAAFRLVRPPNWTPPPPLLAPPWSLSPEEAYALVELLLDTLRRQGAVTFPDGVSPADEAFAPRARAQYVREHGSDAKLGILSWAPVRGTNVRFNLLLRLLGRCAPTLDAAAANERATATLTSL
ncbi:MAG TPA: DEAD/DEAH box helicase, partial [Methylomirabilota bacterium]|nr:DEAD/DEAH box helicase [Methylomirabilota bacterium]